MAAPVILFAYNRPHTTLQTLEALAQNEMSDATVLYAFIDGAKNDDDRKLVREVTDIISSKSWTKKVQIVSAATNKGLANSVIEGVTGVLTTSPSVIVLEDDIVTSPYFLRFMNDGLRTYEHAKNVFSINAFLFPIDIPEVKSFLSPWATTTWGWATWADRWKYFEHVPTQKKIIQENPFIRSRFNVGDYDFAAMLDNENSWGIRWYYTAFMRNALGAYPSRSLCKNIGFGEGATHTKESFPQQEIFQHPIPVSLDNAIDLEIYARVVNYFKMQKEPYSVSLMNRIKKKLIGS